MPPLVLLSTLLLVCRRSGNRESVDVGADAEEVWMLREVGREEGRRAREERGGGGDGRGWVDLCWTVWVGTHP
jgi:hypothetical protein